MKFVVTCRSSISNLGSILVEPTTGRMYKMDEPFIVLSVKDVGEVDVPIPEHDFCRGILRLEFHDCDKEGEHFVGIPLRAIRPDDGKRIVDFYREHSDVGMIVTQCEAGISRSSAMAAALSKLIEDDDSRFFNEFHPNRLVYRTIINAACGTFTGE